MIFSCKILYSPLGMNWEWFKKCTEYSCSPKSISECIDLNKTYLIRIYSEWLSLVKMSVSDNLSDLPILFRCIWNKLRILLWISDLIGSRTIFLQSVAINLYIEKWGYSSLIPHFSAYNRFISSLITMKFSSTAWIDAEYASHYIMLTLIQ